MTFSSRMLSLSTIALLQSRIIDEITTVFRYAVPRLEDRIPINKHTWPYLFSPLLPLLLMAYLVRRPDTYIPRILLFPIVLFTSLRTGFSYMFTDPELNFYRLTLVMLSLTMIGWALEYAGTKNGIKKLDVTAPGQSSVAAIATNSTSLSSSPAVLVSKCLNGTILAPFSDGVEVLSAMRGIGFDYGKGVPIPSETRPTARGPFLRATFRMFLFNFVALDFMETTLKFIPSLRSSLGGSMFIPSLPWYTRYFVSTFIHVLSCLCMMTGVNMVYYLLTMFGVGVLSQSPSAWPPIFDKPWLSTSLHEFWAKRWQQIFRRTFMVYGGLPGKTLGEVIGGKRLGRLGMVLGTFLASGLLHEFAMYTLEGRLDWRIQKFFLIQGFFVLCETLWKQITGKRVAGWPGTLWVYFSTVILAQPCVDALYRCGLGDGIVIPSQFSPARRIFLPIFESLT